MDFDVILPNGEMCPQADNGIPAFTEPVRAWYGLAEAHGVIYLCGGRFKIDDEKTGKELPLNVF